MPLRSTSTSCPSNALFRSPGSSGVTPASVLLSGNVEAVDKLLTFLGVGLLSALSDVRGRKPLMAWSALGFAATNLLQASAGAGSIGRLYLADLIDGCSSCMTPICQAYVADCSPASRRAQNLGVSHAGRGRHEEKPTRERRSVSR